MDAEKSCIRLPFFFSHQKPSSKEKLPTESVDNFVDKRKEETNSDDKSMG